MFGTFESEEYKNIMYDARHEYLASGADLINRRNIAPHHAPNAICCGAFNVPVFTTCVFFMRLLL